MSRRATVDSSLRLLVMARQHGDEAESEAAVRSFRAGSGGGTRPSRDLEIVVLPCVNADAKQANRRNGFSGVDLNRDHQALRSPEIRSLHRWIRHWEPHLVIDVHTYPTRRRHLVEQDLAHCHDVFVDVPTHPAIRTSLDRNGYQDLMQSVCTRLRTAEFRAERYVVIQPSGRLRHSTLDVVDARNGIALRYEIPVILLEGRAPAGARSSRRSDRTTAALRTALESVADWAYAHRDALLRAPDAFRPLERVPIRCRYRSANGGYPLDMRRPRHGGIERVWFPHNESAVDATKTVRLPLAYAVSVQCSPVIRLLRRHGFRSIPGDQWGFAEVSCSQMAHIQTRRARSPGGSRFPLKTWRESRSLAGHVVFPVDQRGGHALAVFLEPRSRHSLLRYPDLGLDLDPGRPYPIVRVRNSLPAGAAYVPQH